MANDKKYILKVEKGADASKIKVMAELMKELPAELFEEQKSDDEISKFFGGTKKVAKQSFKATLTIEIL